MSITDTLALLAEHPEGLTCSDVAEALGVSQSLASADLSRLCQRRAITGRRAHICGWQVDHPGARKYPRARYALGDKPNAKKPKIDAKARYRAQYHSRVARSIASVFDLGLSINSRLAGKRAPL